MENLTANSSSEAASLELKNSSGPFSRLKISRETLKYGAISFGILALIIGGLYWHAVSQRIYSEKAEIYAPLIIISPSQPSILQEILVKEGDRVSARQPLAKLDNNQLVRAKVDGIVVSTNNEIGKLFSSGMPVVTMINPDDLRLIAHVAENKGLNSVSVGQKVIFNVDAFNSKKFYGEVEEVAQSADQSSVVFSISDKRAEKDFSVKIKYDQYPELLNGMSAKAWIYK